MFFSIYIRVLPYTGESVNTYRCNVSLTSVRNSYVRYCYPTDSTMDEHDCILLWIWHHPHKDGKSLQDISQSKHQKESNCEYHTIQYYRRVFLPARKPSVFICTMQGIIPFNTVFYMHENHDNSKCAMQGIKDWHMVLLVILIAGVGVVLLIIETAFLRPNLALLPSEEYESGKDVSLQRNVTDLAVT